MSYDRSDAYELPPFHRDFRASGERLTRIGVGEIGGKAHGLAFVDRVMRRALPADGFPEIEIGIPTLVVVATGVFDAFMERNDLSELALSDLPDDRIALAFQKADLPTEMLGDLRTLTECLRTPLAVRSSGLLEDALYRPFAGVYATKMTPNNQPEGSTRFQRLAEAIKYVYASTYFKSAKDYIRSTRHSIREEKMAVVIQEVVGEAHGDRFYPNVSGVARSFNYYPVGGAKREEGVVDLALGLGKTIVDGGLSYSYSPARPKSPPPFASPRELMANTQKAFWAVNVGKLPVFDPIAETEYLVLAGLPEAEYDDTLRHVASTYVPQSDRLSPGVGVDGQRILNFAPLLQLDSYPLNAAARALLAACRDAVGRDVEIEFAMAIPRARGARAQMGCLQLRPMVVSEVEVQIEAAELAAPDTLLASDRVMGNGVVDTIADVVYVKPGVFEARHTKRIAGEIEQMNSRLLGENRPYLLIGFGRWGSSDPWLGIPVQWGQICGARAIVEATRPDMMIEASQGSHFFHNITSFEVSYFSVWHESVPGIDWDWLDGRPAVAETEFVRLVRAPAPLLVKVDGRSGRGGIWHRG
jgi:hypothetical protein